MPRRPTSTARKSSRARSEPRRYVQRNVPRRWRHRLEPEVTKEFRPHGLTGAWLKTRRVLWSAWPWALLMLVALVRDEWGAAIAAGTVAFVMRLTAAREQPLRYGLRHEVPVGSEAFLASLAGMTGARLVEGNQLTILENGDGFYPAMLEAIDGAKESVTLEAYIFWDGDICRRFARALADAAGRGVEVRLLLDAVGSATIGAWILSCLADGGCQVAWFNPIRWYTLDRFNQRTHRKSLIVDGRIGFTGGAGIGDPWCGRADGPDSWRDLMIRIEGPGVVPLQTGFTENWLETTGELLSGETYYPTIAPAGPSAVQTILSSPTSGASSARLMYYFALSCAQRSILIANPYFVPDPVAIETLVRARRRGVEVHIVVAGKRNDMWLARQNSVRLYGPLLAAGIEIHEYNRTMLHHKTMVVDGCWATLGTANFDNRSFAHNEEANVCFADRARVRELETILLADLDAAVPVSLERWCQRGALQRGRELVASLFEAQV